MVCSFVDDYINVIHQGKGEYEPNEVQAKQ